MTFGTFSSTWVSLSIDLMFSLMLKVIPCIIKLIVAFWIPLKPFWIGSWFICISRRCGGFCIVFFRRCGWFSVLRRKVWLFPCPPLRTNLRFWPPLLRISSGFDFLFLFYLCFWFSFGCVSEPFTIALSAIADGVFLWVSAVAEEFKLLASDPKGRRHPIIIFTCLAHRCGWVDVVAFRRCGRFWVLTFRSKIVSRPIR